MQRYNINIHLAFIDLNEAFDFIELCAIFQPMDNARIDSRYKSFLDYIYERTAMQVKIGKNVSTELISVRTGVRQEGTISTKLFKLVLEDILKKLNWDRSGLKIEIY